MALLLPGCKGARYYSKRADDLEEAGMYEEAADYYFEALIKNPDHVPAKIGIKETGERVLNAYLERFFKAYAAGEDRKAVYAYREARAFHEKISHFVNVDFPSYRERDYQEVEARYLDARYQRAQALLDSNAYEAGRSVLDEILSIKSDYRDAASLRAFAEAEPAYRVALSAYRDGRYREAYRGFSRVRTMAPDYKDVRRLMDLSLDKAALTIALLPFESPERVKSMRSLMHAQILDAFAQLDEPLLRIIDRKNTEELLREQKLALSGMVDEATAAQAGQLVGARAVFTGKIISYEVEKKRPEVQTQPGWKAVRVRYRTEAGKTAYRTEYRKTQYREVRQSQVLAMSFQFQLIDSETGEVLLTRLLQEENRDEVSYADYEGDKEVLYPGFWKSMNVRTDADKVMNSASSKSRLDQKLSARRRLRSEAQLREQLTDRIARQVAHAVYHYLQP